MNAKIFAVAAVMLFALGCGHPAGQIAAGYGGELAADLGKALLKAALKPKPPEKIIIDKEIEKYKIGTHDVRFYEGSYLGAPSILLIAKYVDENKSERKRNIVFRKNSHFAMKEFNSFSQLDEAGKRQQIRNWFIKFQDFDLGPDPEPADKPPASPESPPTPPLDKVSR